MKNLTSWNYCCWNWSWMSYWSYSNCCWNWSWMSYYWTSWRSWRRMMSYWKNLNYWN